MKAHVLAAIAAISMLATGCIIVDDSSFTVDNESDYVITELYIAPTDARTWGPDLLGSNVLFPGDSITITGIDCDDYDVQVYDELGASCELLDIDLCFDDAVWVITNSDLAFCDQWGSLNAEHTTAPLRPDAPEPGEEIL